MSSPLFAAPPSEGAFSLLLPELQRALADEGYASPTPVQAQCIPHLLQGKDLLGSAQTGTGKTAAFTLPLLQYVATHPKPRVRKSPRVLVLAPTRELAAQIGDSVRTYGRHLPIRRAVIFGGVGQRPQEDAMRDGVDFLVATPGRLLDLLGQGLVSLQTVEAFVLDEADRMLDMGFIRDIRKIVALIPERRQTLFFSATLSPEITSLATTLLKNPVRVTIAPEQPTVERIEQHVLFVDRGDKDTLLESLIREHRMDKVIVFTQQKHAANKVTERLLKGGINAAAIHGNKSQGARTRALEGFRSGEILALVATDLAARGLDIDGVTHVINYHLPVEPETYVHRIGRTARAGSDGDAYSFCAAEERDQLRAIERLIRKPIPVVRTHPFHSDTAERATGKDAQPLPRGSQGRPPSRGRSQGSSASNPGATSNRPPARRNRPRR